MTEREMSDEQLERAHHRYVIGQALSQWLDSHHNTPNYGAVHAAYMWFIAGDGRRD